MEEFIVPLGLSQNRLWNELGVSPRRINEIVHGKRRITADIALRLGIILVTLPDSGLVYRWIMTWIWQSIPVWKKYSNIRRYSII